MAKRLYYRRILNPEVDIFFARIFEATGCKTQVELSKFLNITQSSISDAQRRGNVPAEWLVKLLLRHNINPAWILTGKHSKELLAESESLTLYNVNAVETKTQENQLSTLNQFNTEDLIAEVARRVRV